VIELSVRPILRTSDFDYDLPPELIAQEPSATRDQSRLLVVDRAHGTLHDTQFSHLPDYLTCGDVLIANQSRVIPARLEACLLTGGTVEVLLTRELDDRRWEALARPARKLRLGTRLHFDDELEATVIEVRTEGLRILEFTCSGSLRDHIERIGKLPLPPYIKRYPADPERYQTVYAQVPGSVAAPTAGLHFTPELLKRLAAAGIEIHFITLHVGPGTFAPVRSENLDEIHLHAEYGIIPEGVATAVQHAKSEGRRIVAVGTTTTRLLEAAYQRYGRVVPMAEEVDLFIYPPFTFGVVDALITNFHLPRSTLLMLVSAFAGSDLTRRAYEHAVACRYRFYSFGDAMLII
jgi:S-adenosylmethionine:tRNA ribosyltransferase-isomerase